MSDKINDGGAAFPMLEGLSKGRFDNYQASYSDGMTLRDYFAAKAMQALISKYEGEDGSMETIPVDAYQYADAMLAARGAA